MMRASEFILSIKLYGSDGRLHVDTSATMKSMRFTESIFKAYDIRGLAGSELTVEVAHGVGRVLADFLPHADMDGAMGQVVVGRDMREDSTELAEALIAGLVQQGRTVIDIGLVTSDMVYFAVGQYGFAGGAMVTASHNPGQYNGIKLTAAGVAPLGQDSGLDQLKTALVSDSYQTAKPGGRVEKRDIASEWMDHALRLAGALKPLKVGIDFGNGMAAINLPALGEKTQLQIEALYSELDGSFPNHGANPLIRENLTDLSKLVNDKKLDLGVAFDGDGDRAFLVDEAGEPVSASVLGAILASDVLQRNPGAMILRNVITSNIVPDTVAALHGRVERTRVGHSFVKAKMREVGAALAIEHSGHFYFADNFNADSGLIAALKAIAILGSSGKKLSELAAPFKRYSNSGEVNIEVADKEPVVQKVRDHYKDGRQDELDGLTVRYGNWWFNLRASNTEPYLRLNVESGNGSLTQEKTAELLELIKA